VTTDPRACADPEQVASWIPVTASGGQWRLDVDDAASHAEFAVELDAVDTP
jgi:hypothetical protein